ncbi:MULTISPECIES: hypothetical protein [unclassified Rathayibacter]|uniref:hypothetical protein n=1 Tax=unclassified Rathayibacter TaxID=2609250 RepID=UPI00188BDF99|nr:MULTISPECIES: hypothetical protein [unclassified Rathayibacter]MBF4461354.1 hypothetical protein [Rathayibacter sp. VKM Ac-2879]MBF4502765.1 hypothetical protein [Rathayibacter sp. VKM Ac-2878]
MTKNSFDKFRDVGSPLSEWTIPAEDGVHRRTIVKGAAWTIPVVAVAVATPAAAASATPKLEFTQGSYTGNGCETITGVQVKRTTDGTTPDAGKVVTVTLKDGFTFADGTTTYSATTNSSGLITLPNINVPTGEKSTMFNATSDTLAASAPVTSTAYAVRGFHKPANSSTGSSSLIRAGYKDATVYGDAIFLTSDGMLYNGAPTGAPQLIDSNVTSVSQIEYDSKNNLFLNYVTKSGDVRIFKKDGTSNTGSSSLITSGQTDATAYGDGIYLTSGGSLFFDSQAIGTDVASVSQVNYDSANNIYIDYVTKTGEVRQFYKQSDQTTGSSSAITTGQTGATALGDTLYLTSSGELKTGTTSIATGVASASQVEYDSQNGVYMDYVTTTGDVYTYYRKSGDATGTVTKQASGFTGATALGDRMFLTSDGKLYNGGQLVDSNVTSASQIAYDSTNGFYMDYVTSSNSSC